jgi:hypothetical protein
MLLDMRAVVLVYPVLQGLSGWEDQELRLLLADYGRLEVHEDAFCLTSPQVFA